MRAARRRDHEPQPERRDNLAEQFAVGRAHVLRVLDEIEPEHRVREHDAGERARDLRDEIPGQLRARHPAKRRFDQRHDRIEVRARDRREAEDEHVERGAGRDRVGEQHDRCVAGGERLAHDPGADHGREQQRRTDEFSGEALHSPSCFATMTFMISVVPA